jgi:NAD(P)H-flavin reductase
VFEENDETYMIRGPTGMGLDIQNKGVHIAFAGGTGVLIFLDLVAHLLRKIMGLLT